MNFSSYYFWQTLALCYFTSRLLIGLADKFLPSLQQNVGKICLATTGLVLLGSESLLTLCAFLWVVGLSWLGVILASRNLFKKNSAVGVLIFLVLLSAQLTPLFYYKYWDFVLNQWLGLGLGKPSVLIPMGLSFYTFQKVGFWIDTIRNPEKRPKFLDYLNFCSFFPQIVAGPIETKESLLPQIQGIHFKIRTDALEPALRWIVLGFAYKLIVADNLGELAPKFYSDPSSAWHIWFECLTFGMRIYFDFAGYSFIAVGLGLLMGVKLTMNFHCPYCAQDLREFWRTWHITLGAWLRNYIYLPLGGRRVRWWIFNTILVFLVSGIWHGAGWGFLMWGLLHGIGVAFCGIGKPWTRLGSVRWFVTFAYTMAAWLFFLERNPQLLRQKALSLFQLAAYSITNLKQLPQAFTSPADAITTGLILLLALVALLLEGLGVRKGLEPYSLARFPLVTMALIILIVLLAPTEESPFIYFNF
jgi:alginate O-acetyltransferase complex protein AlgI